MYTSCCCCDVEKDGGLSILLVHSSEACNVIAEVCLVELVSGSAEWLPRLDE